MKIKEITTKHSEFSKLLLMQESALIWIMTLAFIVLAFYCVLMGYVGSLPWLSTMVALPWSAYGISQAFYYNKSKAENTKGGIKYETTIHPITKQYTPKDDTNEDQITI